MKKAIVIIVLGLLWCNVVLAEIISISCKETREPLFTPEWSDDPQVDVEIDGGLLFLKVETVPGWLSTSKRVVFNDINADPPMTQEVKLIQSNPDSAHIKLSDGKDVKAGIENLYPVLNGNKGLIQDQDLIELNTENDSVIDTYDSDSEILCLNEDVPTYPTVKIDPNVGELSSFQESVASEPLNFNVDNTIATPTV